MVRFHSCPLYGPLVKGLRHRLFTAVTRVRIPYGLYFMEDYPSPAEGNGLENRQACKSVRGFESHILLNINAGWSSSVARRAHNPKVVGSNPAPAIFGSVAQLVEQWIEAPCVGGSIPSRAICLYFGRVAKRLNAADCKSAPSGSGVRIPPLP